MKIAYITSHFPYGPGERFFEPEVHTLAQLGQEVIIVPTRPRKGYVLHGEIGVPVLRLGVLDLRTLILAVAEAMGNPRRVWLATRDVLSTHYRLSTKLKNLVLLPKALAVAHELRRERVDHIHAQWLSTPSTIGYVAAALTGIPWSCTAHRFDLFQDNLVVQKTASAQFIRLISARARDVILQKAGYASASRCKIVHLGVSVPARVHGPANNGMLRILCAANLCRVKGHQYLIAALAKLRDQGIPFECDFAGGGTLRPELEDQIARNRLRGFIRFRGLVAHERLCAELSYGRYDVFVLASTEDSSEFEGIPVALMEAMAAGIPCVATRTGSIPELIEDGVCSRLVPQRDVDALARAIADFALHPLVRIDYGKRARECVVKHFDTQRTTKELFDLIRESSSAGP